MPIGMNRYDSKDGTFVHLINYDYSEEADQVKPAEEVTVTLKDLPGRNVRVHRLDAETDEYTLRYEGDACVITLRNVPVYTVIEIS